MTAAQAVFDTCELLGNIISLVPAYQIRELRQVSKCWNQLIKSSPRIRRARCLQPITWSHDGSIPVFLDTTKHFNGMRFHPALGHVIGRYHSSGCKSLGKVVWMKRYHAEKSKAQMDQYATNPRCEVLGLELADHDFPFKRWPCTLYVKNGIKVRDILHVQKSLITAHEHYALTTPQSISFFKGGRELEDLTHITIQLELASPEIELG